MRQRLPFADFTAVMMEMLRNLSLDYSRGKEMPTEPDITTKQYRDAAIYFKNLKKVIVHEDESNSHFTFVLKSTKNCETENELSFEECAPYNFTTFDEFIENGFNMYWNTNLSKGNYFIFVNMYFAFLYFRI